MAEIARRWQDNVAGRFYVDKECILCTLCHEIAPDNFRESEQADHDVVYKQPTNDQELSQCIEAMDSCPVEAIGDDGA